MTRLIEAIFENGAFRPVRPEQLRLSEGQAVHLRIDLPDREVTDPIELAMSVFAGLSPAEIDAIESIAVDRSHFMNNGDSA